MRGGTFGQTVSSWPALGSTHLPHDDFRGCEVAQKLNTFRKSIAIANIDELDAVECAEIDES